MSHLIAKLGEARHIGLGGGFGSGKDYVAIRHFPGRTVIKVAAPLYRLAATLLGRPVDKTDPGGRETLQRLGAWGRGEVNSQHPLSAERAAAVAYIRDSMLPRFGTSPSFWADAFIGELTKAPGDTICTDIRFPEEIDRFNAHGPTVFVLCSPITLAERRARCGYKPSAASDPSEAIAESIIAAANRSTTELFNAIRLSGFRSVFWNDTPTGPTWDVVSGLALPVYTEYP